MAAEAVVELGRRAAVDPHEGGEAFAGRAARGAIEVCRNREAVRRGKAHLLGHHEALAESCRKRTGQAGRLARRDVDHEEVLGLGGRAHRIAHLRPVRRPLGLRDRSHRLRPDELPRRTARRGDDMEAVGSVPVGDVDDLAAVGRPSSVALLGVVFGDGARLAALTRDDPEVVPAVAHRAKEHVAPVGRRQRRAEGEPGAVVEEPAILHDEARLAAVGRDLEDVVVDPTLVHAHVEDALPVGHPRRIDLVAGVRGETGELSVGDRDGVDVLASVAVVRENDAGAVGRPLERVDPASEVRELQILSVVDGPEPDLGGAALGGHVAHPLAVRGPGGLLRARRAGADEAEILGQQLGESPFGGDRQQVQAAAQAAHKEDAASVRGPQRRVAPGENGANGEQIVDGERFLGVGVRPGECDARQKERERS